MTAFLKKTDQIAPKIPIELSDRRKVLPEKDNKAVHEILIKFATKFSRYIKINLIESTIDAYRNKRGKITNFQVHIQVYPTRGKAYVAEVEDKKLMNAVHTAIKKIKHQSNHNH